MSHKLKPCPFCESEDLTIAQNEEPSSHSYGMYFVVCWDCYANGPYEKKKNTAIKKWNQRMGEKP